MNKLLSTIGLFLISIFVFTAAFASAQAEANLANKVEEVKIIKDQSGQYFEDEAYLLKKALGNQTMGSYLVEQDLSKDTEVLSCLMMGSIIENIEIGIQLPNLSDKSDSLISKVYTVKFIFDPDLKKHLLAC